MSASLAQIVKISIFGNNLTPRDMGHIPLSNFYKIRHGWESPRSAPCCQTTPLSLSKCGLTTPKIAKINNFWYKFVTKKYICLSNFYKIDMGEGVLDLHLHAKVHRCGFKHVQTLFRVLCLFRQVQAWNDASLLYHELLSLYVHIQCRCSSSNLSL